MSESWVSQLIQTELVPVILEIDDIVADGRVNSMGKDSIKRHIKSQAKIAGQFSTIMESIADVRTIERKDIVLQVAKTHEIHYNSLLLYGHDSYMASWHASVQGNFSPIHTLVNTILSMAYICSGSKEYLRELNAEASIKSIARYIDDKTKVRIERGINTFDSGIYTCLLNLYNNANREGPANIEIILSDTDPQFVVSDDGPGIEKKVLKELFGGYSSTGGGLGLQIAKKIIDLKEGYISVESTAKGKSTYTYDTKNQVVRKTEKKPRGTTFSIHLPTA